MRSNFYLLCIATLGSFVGSLIPLIHFSSTVSIQSYKCAESDTTILSGSIYNSKEGTVQCIYRDNISGKRESKKNPGLTKNPNASKICS